MECLLEVAVASTGADESIVGEGSEGLALGEQESLVELLGAAEGVDEDGVEEFVGEAEVVLLEPRNDGVGKSNVGGGVGGAEGLEEGVPEWSRDSAVGLGQLELGRVE
ncbi:hypothetical protein ACFX2J_008251 [Malus domestica]